MFSHLFANYRKKYNETINDLLGKGEFDKKKHEIKHDPKTGSTRVTDVEVVRLTSPSQVKNLLTVAQSRRSVAATLMNERSSRSHSVFTLRIMGVNVGIDGCAGTGERCEGSLNLVDLAGSERLNVSFANGADKERVRETQNINRSLSALGDVIAALGEKGEKGGDKHIPYRNSKVRSTFSLMSFVKLMIFGLNIAYILIAKFVERKFEDSGTLIYQFMLATFFFLIFLLSVLVDGSQPFATGGTSSRILNFFTVCDEGMVLIIVIFITLTFCSRSTIQQSELQKSSHGYHESSATNGLFGSTEALMITGLSIFQVTGWSFFSSFPASTVLDARPPCSPICLSSAVVLILLYSFLVIVEIQQTFYLFSRIGQVGCHSRRRCSDLSRFLGVGGSYRSLRVTVLRTNLCQTGVFVSPYPLLVRGSRALSQIAMELIVRCNGRIKSRHVAILSLVTYYY